MRYEIQLSDFSYPLTVLQTDNR